ncbi:hypothetical protein ScPMuIL_014945 [Solemya velum]
MAALMRYSRFLPVMRNISLGHGLMQKACGNCSLKSTTVMRNSVFNKHARQISRTSTSSQLSAKFAEVTRPKVPASPAERLLLNINNDVSRFNRVSEEKFMNLVKIMDASELTSLQANMILRCTGALLYDMPPSQRSRLADEIWAKLENGAVTLDVTHYNTLLRVYIENKQPFLPTEILARLEAKGIAANRVTFQHLISQYCQNGDIQGASQILEHMKSLSMPITDIVFNSLITGHFKANDVDGALATMKLMRETGMEPGNHTYGTMVQGYAERGDINEMKRMVEEAEMAGVPIKPTQLMESAYTLTVNGYAELVPEMLTVLQRMNVGFRVDGIKCINSLIFEGHDDVAYQVFEAMQKPSRLDADESTFGRFFIRALIKNDRPLEKVFKLVTEMSEHGYNRDGVNSIPQIAYLLEKTEFALAALEKVKSEGHPIRMHYLWPAICQFRKKQDKEGIYGVAERMQTLPNDPKLESVRTVEDYILPSLVSLGETVESALESLQKRGLHADLVNFAGLTYLIRDQGLKQALEFAQGRPMTVLPGALRAVLKDKLGYSKDWQSAIQILGVCSQNETIAPADLGNVMGDVLVQSCRLNRQSVAVVEQILDMYSQQNLKIFAKHEAGLRKIDFAEDVPELIWEKVRALVTQAFSRSPPRSEPMPGADLMKMSAPDLEKLSEENDKNLTVKKWLLMKYCATGKIEQAEKLISDLDSVGFVYQGILLRQILFMFAWFKQDLETSKEYLDKLETQFPEFENYPKSLLAFAALTVAHGNLQDGCESLKKYAEKHSEFMNRSKFAENYELADFCCRVVTAAAKAGTPEEVLEILKAVFDYGYVKKGAFSVLGEYVQGFIDKGDVSGALEAFSLMVKHFQRAPKVNELFLICVQREDPESLQKVLDMSIPFHGEMNLLNQLMCNFVECGQEKKARKVLETPGIRAMMARLKVSSNKFLSNNMVTEMEKLVDITKDMFAIDRDDMLFQLMRLYVKIGEFGKAVDLLTRYEEEDIQPRARTLRYLGKVLQSKEMEVPFQIPPAYHETRQVVGRSLNSETDNLRRHREFSNLVIDLASKGDVETLQHMKIQKQFTSKLLPIKRNLFNAYINSGRTDEVLAILEEDPNDAGQYVTMLGIGDMIAKSPEKMDRFEEIAIDIARKGQLAPLNNLWMHYFLESSEKADTILQDFPVMLKTLRVTEACVAALKNEREDQLTSLAALVRNHNARSLTIAYSYLSELHCKNNDADSAVLTLEQMKGDGIKLEALNRKVAEEVRSLLREQNKEIPPGVSEGSVDDADQSSSDSSSSSSSDSDRGK